ncbi:MAG TPA: SIS domain-containing protein [Segeticoccus sp.]|uniref:SIS domain-containing protein n=1 Tax=Segeticoccus sp. TaxID=2706531 RepID=UPI002D7F6D87|nr:SIS domain-containing protein [Segeticoccus sp.]HET8600904.1 SIS domain-containing protein [Segeticoccus sp.]
MTSALDTFHGEVVRRLDRLAQRAAAGELDAAIDLLAEAIKRDGIIQVFGTGHSEGFSMEVAGRAGGLIATNSIRLRDLVIHGGQQPESLSGSDFEQGHGMVEQLWGLARVHPQDVFVIASNSGVNGSIVGMAVKAKESGHKIIAVTSLEHTSRVQPLHPSGHRLLDLADVVIDNLAPYGDTTLPDGTGAVSSLTASFIAQQLTIGVVQRLAVEGVDAPIYLSANTPGGREHNAALEARYEGRLLRTA